MTIKPTHFRPGQYFLTQATGMKTMNAPLLQLSVRNNRKIRYNRPLKGDIAWVYRLDPGVPHSYITYGKTPIMSKRQLTPIDQLIDGVDRALRTLTDNTNSAARKAPHPQGNATLDDQLTPTERKHAAGLMRVNHSGEVCAQALYQGQALTAKLPDIRRDMEDAADEEIDHLAWCEERLRELGSHTSALNPLWYAMSFGIGAGAGLISDRLSLGFVAATEELVCKHLSDHLESLPANDTKSSAVIAQMLEDESKHAATALEKGGMPFPSPAKAVMGLVSKLMTKSSYRI